MSTDIATTNPTNTSIVANRPAYLSKHEDQAPKGIGNLVQYYTPPFASVLQGTSSPSLKALYGEASVVVTPQNILVAETDLRKGTFGSFTFTPILNFTEWAIVNPHGVKDLPFMRERTTDPKSEIAKRARNFRDPGVRVVDCPEAPGKDMRYCEFIYYLCIIDSVDELRNMPVLMSFWSTGHSDGRMLANLVLARQAHIYSLRFQATVGPRKNEQNNWWGLNITNPSDGMGFVQEEEDFLRYQKFHDQYEKMRQEGAMDVQHEENMEPATPVADANTTEF